MYCSFTTKIFVFCCHKLKEPVFIDQDLYGFTVDAV